MLGFAPAETATAPTTMNKEPLIGFSEAHLLQQVHGAGETTMASFSRDSTRSGSMDSTASLGHKADAELMVSFSTEMHSTGTASSKKMDMIMKPAGSVAGQPPPPSRTHREKDHAAAWEGNGESLLLCLKTKDPSSSAPASSPYATPPSAAKEKDQRTRPLSWGEQPTLTGVHAKLSSFGSATSMKTKPSEEWARMEEEEEEEQQQGEGGEMEEGEVVEEEEEEEEEGDAKMVVAFRQAASSSSFSDSESGGRSRGSSSSSSSEGEGEDGSGMSADEEGGTRLAQQRHRQQQQQQHHRAASSGSWTLFNCLVTEAGNGSRKLARQRERTYNCPWYRVGYYRRCHDKYGQDASVYDSEDSDYEEGEREVEDEGGREGREGRIGVSCRR